LPTPTVADDTMIREEPSRHVDYLSHDWREEDIWASWRHIVSQRRVYGEKSRLENASWRTWAKSKYRLRTVSPEKLNW
jgi:fibrillarin-like rRNA methylase